MGQICCKSDTRIENVDGQIYIYQKKQQQHLNNETFRQRNHKNQVDQQTKQRNINNKDNQNKNEYSNQNKYYSQSSGHQSNCQIGERQPQQGCSCNDNGDCFKCIDCFNQNCLDMFLNECCGCNGTGCAGGGCDCGGCDCGGCDCGGCDCGGCDCGGCDCGGCDCGGCDC